MQPTRIPVQKPLELASQNPLGIDFLSIFFGLLIFTTLFFVFIAIALFLIRRERDKKQEKRSLDSVLLLVAVPRSNEVRIDAMDQLFASLASIKKSGWKMRFDTQPVISFELVAKQEEIKFYVWTSKKLQDLVEKQIHGAYADAEIKEVPEYNIFNEEGYVAYKSLQLKKENYLPIKTYRELSTDPLSALTSALAKMGEGEGASIQLIIRPTSSSWQSEGRSHISDVKKQESNPEKAKFGTNPKTLESIENKIGKPGFEISIRIVVVSKTLEQAKSHLENITTSFSQFDGEQNGFKGRKVFRKGAFVEDFVNRYMPAFNVRGNRISILNSEELATVFHFPNKQVTTPHIHWLNAKSAPAPSQIPNEGLYLGKSSYRGIDRSVYLGDADRLRHIYIIGKTGTGKTKFLLELMKQDIKAGKGLCFMDPHGDAVEELLEFIPPERAQDVIYFRPSDLDRPMGINLMEAKTEQDKHFVATAIINLMYKLFDPYKTGIVGPRFEHAVRNAMLTVMCEPGTTFIEVMRVLTDQNYVKELLPKVSDPIVRRYWTDQIAQTSDFHKSEVLDYITSKFGRFVTNKMIRNIIGQSQSSFNFREIMDNQKILLVNLSKGEMGEENSSFLGLLLVPRILMAAMSRADIPEEQRKEFYLYVDEFQNFATPDFAQILSEARKYRLGLIVANQFVGQIDDEIRNAIFGNVGTLISYRVGVQDAGILAQEFRPVFDADDLQNIEKYHVYARTLVGNEPVPAFSMSLFRDQSVIKKERNSEIANIIKEMSRVRFGRDVNLVDAEITKRARL